MIVDVETASIVSAATLVEPSRRAPPVFYHLNYCAMAISTVIIAVAFSNFDRMRAGFYLSFIAFLVSAKYHFIITWPDLQSERCPAFISRISPFSWKCTGYLTITLLTWLFALVITCVKGSNDFRQNDLPRYALLATLGCMECSVLFAILFLTVRGVLRRRKERRAPQIRERLNRKDVAINTAQEETEMQPVPSTS